MTFLKNLIKETLSRLPKEVKEVSFEVDLFPDCSISKTPTGIKVKFNVKRKK